MSNQNETLPALGVAPRSAVTLMRGTPEEIERDLAAIDERLAEMKKQRDCAQKAFEFEMRANARLEKDNGALRIALRELVDAEDASCEQFTLAEIDRIEKAMRRAREILSLPTKVRRARRTTNMQRAEKNHEQN